MITNLAKEERQQKEQSGVGVGVHRREGGWTKFGKVGRQYKGSLDKIKGLGLLCQLWHKIFICQEGTTKGTTVNCLIHYHSGILVNWIHLKFLFSKFCNTSV